jgi:hypothetical protein
MLFTDVYFYQLLVVLVTTHKPEVLKKKKKISRLVINMVKNAECLCATMADKKKWLLCDTIAG